jgi:hypothetical protein
MNENAVTTVALGQGDPMKRYEACNDSGNVPGGRTVIQNSGLLVRLAVGICVVGLLSSFRIALAASIFWFFVCERLV